jgi:hypothetical protein
MIHLTHRADVTYKPAGVRTGRVICQRTGAVITRPHTPIAICQRAAQALGTCQVEPEPDHELITIERLRRTRCYRLDQLTPASRDRLQHILRDPDWPTRDEQPDGWLRLISRTPTPETSAYFTPTQQGIRAARAQAQHDPDDALNATSLRDGADVFVKRDADGTILKVTIDRPDRTSRDPWTDRTYTTLTPASRQRLAALVDGRWWPTRTLANGWDAVTTR